MTFTTRPTLRGTFGMVASTHWIASSVGMSVLERGGNAFDAAVATGFVLHLVEPHLNGPGGDLPAIIVTADEPRPRVLCAQGPAPARATIEAFRGLGYDEIPGSGPLAAAVPGAVDGWLVLLRDHGTWTVGDVLAPAIAYARDGAPMVERIGATVEAVRELFTRDWPTSAAQWLPGGRSPRGGEVVRNPVLADTWERLVVESRAGGGSREEQVERARRAWSQGFVAEAVDAFAQTPVPVDGVEQPFLLRGEDLAAYESTWEDALVGSFAGYEIAKTGPWGQGPVLLEALGMLESLGGEALDVDTEVGAHSAVEALKLALADREAWYGDAIEVPIETLTSRAYLAERARLITDEASHEVRPGSPDGRIPRLSAHGTRLLGDESADAGAGEPTVDASGRTRGDTCHIDIVDRWGNMISATPSGGWLQSSPIIPALGFPLGSRLQMSWLEEGLASTLVPGRRPRTTLSPTLVLRDGRPFLACGTPGGDQQDQWQLVFLLRVLAQGMDLQQAIDAPSLHTLSAPGSFWPRRTEPGVVVVEDRMDDAILAGLRRRGHRVRLSDPWSLGRLSAVTRDVDGVMEAAANPRGMQGYAVGR